MTTISEPGTNTGSHPDTTMAQLARAGWIAKTGRSENLPDPWFASVDDHEVLLTMKSYDDLTAWSLWLEETIDSGTIQGSGHGHHAVQAVLWDIPVRVVFIDRSTAVA